MSLYIVFLLFTIVIRDAHSNCDQQIQWDAIIPTDYDLTYSPITDTSARPLGFKVATWRHDYPSICVEVMGTRNKRIEVKFATDPSTRLCVKSEDLPKYCASGRGSQCMEFIGENAQHQDTTKFEFFCDSECPEEDVNFWYRFVVSPGNNSNSDEIWCRDRDSRVPGDLLTVPIIVSPSPEVRDDGNGGITAKTQNLSFLIILIVMLIIII